MTTLKGEGFTLSNTTGDISFPANPWTMEFKTDPEASLRDELLALRNLLTICVVCGDTAEMLLCAICVEAVKLARQKWLEDAQQYIEECLN